MSNSNTVKTPTKSARPTIAQLVDGNSNSKLDNDFISVISKHYNSDVDTFIKNYSTIRYNDCLVDIFISSYTVLMHIR